MNLKHFREGYIICFKGNNGFFTNQIKKAQLDSGISKENSEYTHVAMSLGGDWVVEALLNGVKIRSLVKSYINRDIIVVKPKIADYGNKRKNVAIHALTRVNVPYGFLGLLWFKVNKVFKKNILSSIGDFCSELCGYAVNEEYKQFFDKHYSQLFPADFLNEDKFEIVWEGTVK